MIYRKVYIDTVYRETMETTTLRHTCPIPLLAEDDPSITVNGRPVSDDNPIPSCPICTRDQEVRTGVSQSDGGDDEYATNVETVTTRRIQDNTSVAPVNIPTAWREEWEWSSATGGIAELWLSMSCEQLFGSALGCTLPTRFDLREDN